MKQLYSICLISAVLLSSCVGSKQYASFVNEKLQPDMASAARQATSGDYLSVNTDAIIQNENSTKQLKSFFIPALLYWGWNSTIQCEISPSLTAGYLESSIHEAANKLHLSDKLAGKKLVVTLQEVPGSFVYESKGSVVILVFAHITSASQAILPAQKALVANIELHNGDEVIPGGSIVVDNNYEPWRNEWKSTRKFTWLYLDFHRKDTERMGTELVTKVIQKLEDGIAANN